MTVYARLEVYLLCYIGFASVRGCSHQSVPECSTLNTVAHLLCGFWHFVSLQLVLTIQVFDDQCSAHLHIFGVPAVLLLGMCRFWHFVSQQPVRILEVPDDQTEQEPVQMEAPRFMAVVWGAGQDGDGPTTIVQLDGQGRLTVIFEALCQCWCYWTKAAAMAPAGLC
jgi:hypothetical protein